jgi:hypothetical protein
LANQSRTAGWKLTILVSGKDHSNHRQIAASRKVGWSVACSRGANKIVDNRRPLFMIFLEESKKAPLPERRLLLCRKIEKRRWKRKEGRGNRRDDKELR